MSTFAVRPYNLIRLMYLKTNRRFKLTGPKQVSLRAAFYRLSINFGNSLVRVKKHIDFVFESLKKINSVHNQANIKLSCHNFHATLPYAIFSFKLCHGQTCNVQKIQRRHLFGSYSIVTHSFSVIFL